MIGGIILGLRRRTTAAIVLGPILLLAGLKPAAAVSCNTTIAITEQTQMNFGTIGAVNGGGTVTVSSSGSASGPAGFFLTGTHAAGGFKVTGSKNCAIVISFTSGSLTGPGSGMTVNNFTTNAGASPTLNAQGTFSFNVGASLVVNASQTAGSYSGTYSVTVIY